MREKQNMARTEEAGVPKYDLKPYVEIFIPGEKHNRPDRPVNDSDKERWPVAWAKFEASEEETEEGMPLREWPYLNRAQVAELNALGILTVEALAGMADGLLQNIGPGARDLQKRAKHVLKPQSEAEGDLRKEIQSLKVKKTGF